MQIEFKHIKIGESFFDIESGEYFIKYSNNTAKFMTGGDYFEDNIVDFNKNDYVII